MHTCMTSAVAAQASDLPVTLVSRLLHLHLLLLPR